MRPTTMSRVMVEAACERGLTAGLCLDASGLGPADLEDGGLGVEPWQEFTIVANIVRALGDVPGLGSEAGRRVTLGMFGIVGFAMLSSRTAREAIRLCDAEGYGALAPLAVRPWADERADVLRIVCDTHDIPAAVRGYVVERDLTCALSLLRTMFGAAPRLSVTTTLPRASAEAIVAAAGDARVRAGAGDDAIEIGGELLDRPLPGADERTMAALRRVNHELLIRQGGRTGVAARVRATMLRHRPGLPSLADVAAERHVEPRTLRRQLAAEGTSFRELADEVREARAVELLRAGVPVAQVAYRLGYADAGSFSRAFRRWTGQTPGSVLRRKTHNLTLTSNILST